MSGEDAHSEVLNQDAQGRLRTIIERVERLEQEKSEVMEQIKVGGEPTGVDEDGERFPEVATLPKTSKKGFFSAKKEEGEA